MTFEIMQNKTLGSLLRLMFLSEKRKGNKGSKRIAFVDLELKLKVLYDTNNNNEM